MSHASNPSEANGAVPQTLLDLGAVALFIADARLPDAPIVFVNAGFTRTTGLLRQDVIGRGWQLLSTRPMAALPASGNWSDEPITVELPDLGGDLRGAGTPFDVHRVRDQHDDVTAYVGVSRLGAPRD
ncbi:MAG: hypothetical protein HY060_25160 [Proteobacteria bacterium]|nr:hypothetical protein [Pseudomonadota bacterium]